MFKLSKVAFLFACLLLLNFSNAYAVISLPYIQPLPVDPYTSGSQQAQNIQAQQLANEAQRLQNQKLANQLAYEQMTQEQAIRRQEQIGQTFLEQNKSKPGVITLQDGLQYKVLKAGTGPKPTDQNVVTVKYVGKLINGTEFDSSAKHGGTLDFRVEQVIPGWAEALKLMQPGATWELYIPSELAYGEAGAPPSIGPNEILFFKVTLVGFKKSA